MKSTGGKTSATKLDSLMFSVDRLVHLCSPSSGLPTTDVTTAPSPASYAQRLACEHNKIMGSPIQADDDLLKQFSDPPATTVLKLEPAQRLETKQSHTKLGKAATRALRSSASIRHAKDRPTPTDQAQKRIEPPIKIGAPRATPFSKESHVRVKIITQDIELNHGHIGMLKTETVTWMQRDAIKHYLSIQDIERRRTATEGAVYRSFRHDAQ